MKNLHKGFIVPLLLVIIAVLAIGGGVYVYNDQKAEAPAVVETEVQKSEQAQANSAQTSTTSNWKTYTNANFNIKYPPDYQQMLQVNVTSGRDQDVVSFIPPVPNLNGNELYVNVIKKMSDTLDSYIASFQSSVAVDIKKTSVIVGGINATKIVMTSENVHIEHIILKSGNIIYDIVGRENIRGTFDESQFLNFYNSFKVNTN